VINNPITAAWQQQYTVDNTTTETPGTSTDTVQQAEARLAALNLPHTVYSDDVTTHITGHTLNIPSDDDSDLEDHSATIATTLSPGPYHIQFDAIPATTVSTQDLNLNPLNGSDFQESQELVEEFFVNPPRAQNVGIVTPLRMNSQPDTAVTQSDRKSVV
jgi:hypothetical protein